jgi:hypothetical protein
MQFYCSTECQAADWPSHKQLCRKASGSYVSRSEAQKAVLRNIDKLRPVRQDGVFFMDVNSGKTLWVPATPQMLAHYYGDNVGEMMATMEPGYVMVRCFRDHPENRLSDGTRPVSTFMTWRIEFPERDFQIHSYEPGPDGNGTRRRVFRTEAANPMEDAIDMLKKIMDNNLQIPKERTSDTMFEIISEKRSKPEQ